MSFGRHLRALREAAGLSRRAALPASTLRNWEGDRGFPGPAGLRLAGALGVALERLPFLGRDPLPKAAADPDQTFAEAAGVIHHRGEGLLVFRLYGNEEAVDEGDLRSRRKFLDVGRLLDAKDFDAFMQLASTSA
jgi:hypothetical protein